MDSQKSYHNLFPAEAQKPWQKTLNYCRVRDLSGMKLKILMFVKIVLNKIRTIFQGATS